LYDRLLGGLPVFSTGERLALYSSSDTSSYAFVLEEARRTVRRGRCSHGHQRHFGRVAKRSRVCLWCSQLRGHSSLLFWSIAGAVRRGTIGSALDQRTSPAEAGVSPLILPLSSASNILWFVSLSVGFNPAHGGAGNPPWFPFETSPAVPTSHDPSQNPPPHRDPWKNGSCYTHISRAVMVLMFDTAVTQ